MDLDLERHAWAEPLSFFQLYQPFDTYWSLARKKASTSLIEFINSWHLESRVFDFNGDRQLDKTDVFAFSFYWPDIPFELPSPAFIDWTALRGEWNWENNRIDGHSDLDARLLSSNSFPYELDFHVDIVLREGNGAGFLIWMDEEGQSGYGIRVDRNLHSLVLFRLYSWPYEERLDSYPLAVGEGRTMQWRIVTGLSGIRVYLNGSDFPVLETRNPIPGGNRIGLYLLDASASFQIHSIQPSAETFPPVSIPEAGEFIHLFDQSWGEAEGWYINDHCVVQDLNGMWHLFGITNPYPPDPAAEDQFAHATSPNFLQYPWNKHPFALTTDTDAGESHLWAPHIIEREGVFYMFYCAGSLESHYQYRIHLATSSDLFHWQRYEGNPLFEDYYDARDPMVLPIGDRYVMYYTAILDRPEGNHIVAYRTSQDLLQWSPRKIAFIHDSVGTAAGPVESPFVVKRGGYFYLFIGPDGEYRNTAVYRSPNPFHWNRSQRITTITSHAPEIVHDRDGNWFITHCGWYYNGVYAAPLEWKPQPEVRLFTNTGESLHYLLEHQNAMVSDWLGTRQLDLVADFDSSFTYEFPIPSLSQPVFVQFDEIGEVRVEAWTGNTWVSLLDEGNVGPGIATIHTIQLESTVIISGKIRLRFSDSDPSDGWGPNINWIRILW